MKMEKKMEMKKKLTNIGLAAILAIAVFAAVMGIASAQTQPYYNESGNYIEGINVSVNTSDNLHFNRSCINVPLTFQINTLNASATNFSVDNQSGLTTNATDIMKNDSWFWVNATKAGTYRVNVSNIENSSEYVNFTVEYFFPVETIRIKPETLNLNLKSKGKFTAFITFFPEDGYNVTNISVDTLECEGAPAVKGMIDGDTFIAKFNRQDLVSVSPDDDDAVTLTVTGKLKDGTPFEGNDTIRVKNNTGILGTAKSVLDRWLNGVKNRAEGVQRKFPAFGIADEAASQPGTTPPVPTNTMHVDNITVSTDNRGAGPKNTIVWAVATVTIVDADDVPVNGATVSGLWSGLTSDTDSGTTGSNGEVALKSDSVKNAEGTFNFTVDRVEHGVLVYNPDANKKTDDSITVPQMEI